MKTPRELILERHQAVERKLDQVRARALQTALASAPPPSRSEASASWLGTLWREVVLPARWTWGGMAAAWVVIVGLQASSGLEASSRTQRAERTSPDVLALLNEQRLLKLELLDGPATATTTAEVIPGPKSEGLPSRDSALQSDPFQSASGLAHSKTLRDFAGRDACASFWIAAVPCCFVFHGNGSQETAPPAHRLALAFA